MKRMRISMVGLMFLMMAGLAFGVGAATVKTVRELPLGDAKVTINIYENAGAAVTFFAPHYNERLGTKLAEEFVERRGGRLIEIVSTDERGLPQRHLKFTFAGKSYAVDPNRIYTDNGRRCHVAAEIRPLVAAFAAELLKIMLAPDGRTLRAGERFLVAVHNNTDVSAKAENAQTGDLTAVAFIRPQSTNNLGHGIFEAQADGVFLSNTETDEDNFVFLSTPLYIGHFAEKGFNVVVQKAAPKLRSALCTIDDGSLSVYTAQTAVPYVCLEADGASGALRQRRMLEAVYDLLRPEPVVQPNVAAAK